MEEDKAQDAMAELLCPICWELLHQPHRLNPCLHLFCDPCLRRLARANIQTCPICRAVITGCHLDEGNTNISLKVKRINVVCTQFDYDSFLQSFMIWFKPSTRMCTSKGNKSRWPRAYSMSHCLPFVELWQKLSILGKDCFFCYYQWCCPWWF